MSNKEENIDRFVKKVISHYDVRYDESHWEILEKRLDAEMPVVPVSSPVLNIPTIVISTLGGMALMLGILWMGGTFEEQKADSVNDQENQISGPVEINNTEINVNANPQQFHASSDQNNNNSNVGSENKQSGDIKTDVGIIDYKSRRGSFAINDNALDDGVGLMAYDDEYSKQIGMVHPGPKSFYHAIPIAQHNMLKVQEQQNSKFWNNAHSDLDEAIGHDGRNPFRFGIALGVSPDFNSVGMDDNMALSGQAGFQFITTYKGRVSLATGAYYGKKRYITSGENYFPPGKYWERFTNGVIPQEVDGHIVLIDIPINLTYHWNPQGRIQFISSIGVSNYFILGEDCTYKFDDYNPGAEYGWDTDEMTKELFGVANLSFGILWYLKPKVNIRVEPYLKVPLKEVGWGSVDLYSAGSLISIQYTFN